MSADAQSTFRIPLILLASADLALLGTRLWPWSETTSLPGNGTAALDPAICLVAYIVLSFWIGSAREGSSRKSLFSGGVLGLISGGLVIAQTALAARNPMEEAAPTDRAQVALVGLAVFLCAFAAIRSAWSGHTVGFSALCAAWSGMIASLIGSGFILAQGFLIAGPAQAPDAWRDYQGLAIGTPVIQALVHTLNSVAAYLLLGPLAAAALGAIFASFTKPAKD